MNSLRLIEIGDALGLPLPAAMLARLGLKDGDTIYLKETTEGLSGILCEGSCFGPVRNLV